MNPRYVAAFKEHRRLLLLPIVLAAVVALWYVVGAPKQYESTATFWVDNPAPDGSSLSDNFSTGLSPAAEEQIFVNELLTTREFRLAAGDASPLRAYLAHNSGEGWGPPALIHALRGRGSLDDRVVAALGPKHVTTAVNGPQIFAITYVGPTGAIAAKTVSTLVSKVESLRSSTELTRQRAALAFYTERVNAALTELDNAQTALSSYVADHPESVGTTDPELRILTQAQTASRAQYVTAQKSLGEAKLAAAAPLAANSSSFRVIDPPRVPLGPIGGRKKDVLALFGGLFVGGLVSLLGLVAIVAAEPRLGRRRAQIARAAATASKSEGAPALDVDEYELFRASRARPEQALVIDLIEEVAQARAPEAGDRASTRASEDPFEETEPDPPVNPHDAEKQHPVAADMAYGDATAAEASQPAEHDKTASDVEPEEITEEPRPDLELLAADASGDEEAVRGTILDVRDDGVGRRTVPVWIIHQSANGHRRPDPGSRIRALDLSGREATIRAVEDADDGGLLLEVEITSRKRGVKGCAGQLALQASDPGWRGAEVAFARRSRMKSPLADASRS